MKKFGNFIVKNKVLILIITAILIIPSIIGYIKTGVNYDILTYLPSDIETLKGEKILTDDFKMGAFSIVVVDNMDSKDIIKLEDEYRKLKSVHEVISINDLTGTGIPIEMLPNTVRDKVAKDGTTLILVTFSGSTSDDDTLAAVTKMREISDKNTKIGGMSAMVLDTKELFNREMLLYVIIAVILCIIILELSLDSYLVPFLLIGNIGIAILFNMGSNIMFGEICYITKAIVAILQLGVTTDFSIFLYHQYEKLKKEKKNNDEAMVEAISNTFVSVMGSSLTTIAGFLALCTMKLTLGFDIGLVMAKGVVLGVICVLTVFPALILVFDKQITKTRHKVILPKFTIIKNFVMKHYVVIFVIFLILLFPAYKAQTKTSVYYKLDESMPETYGYKIATKELNDKYGLVTQEMILVDKNKPDYEINEMVDKIKEVDGIDFIINPSELSKYGITENMIPEKIRELYGTDKYKMIIIGSTYDIATDELNAQIDKVNEIIKLYDENSILAGEGPLTKDLVSITDIDLVNVNYASIGAIFLLMLIVLKSVSLPVLLVIAIEFAIFINMGVPYFTDTKIPFIASIVIGTIQLGATIDYAILMTTKYLEERKIGKDKKEAVKYALDNSVCSIFVSAMCFFAATIGVGIVSQIDLIGSLCRLISRGALISMIVVIMIIPSILLIFDKLIIKTTYLKKGNDNMKKNKIKKVVVASLVLTLALSPLSTLALSKEETVYTNLNSDGSIKNIYVNEHLINSDKKDSISDLTDLENIKNINSNRQFLLDNNRITWESKGEDIFFQGTTKKELPIGEEVTYKLDGKEIKLDDLLGKKGKVEITIKYKNKLTHIKNINGHNEEIFTPFVVATVTNIPTSNNKNVEVTNGKVIDNGIGYTVVALSTPGLYESLDLKELKGLDEVTITYDTEKFELSSIYSAATPKIIDASDLDIFDKINDMYVSIDKLQKAMNDLENGSRTILNNLSLISDGSSEISKNLGLVVENLDNIKNGTVELDNGLTQIVEELEKSKETFVSMNEKLTEMQTLINANTNYINGLKSVKTNYETLASYPYEALNDEQKAQLAALKFTYDSFNLGDASKSLITVLEGDNKALSETITAFQKVNEAMNGLNTYLPKLKEGADKLSAGTKQLKEGTALLHEKMNELSTGTAKLKEGMNSLNNGINAFDQKGIKPIVNVKNEAKKISGKLKALTELSDEYQSFSLKDNNTSSNTKFISVIEGKSAPKEEKNIEVKEEKKTNFFDKIVNIFK